MKQRYAGEHGMTAHDRTLIGNINTPKRIFILISISLLFLLLTSLNATYAKPLSLPDSTNDKYSFEVQRDSLMRILQAALDYLVASQITRTIPEVQYAGEWPCYMVMQKPFFLLGVRKKVLDSNCFSVASTHNLLAKIYLHRRQDKRIPDVLSDARSALLRYRNGERFNFWNLLPPQRDLYRGDYTYQSKLVRRPTRFKLPTRYIHKAANVAEDADDTALSYTAFYLGSKISGRAANEPAPNSAELANLFDAYRDKNRNNRHWFNYLNDHALKANTGAYLTWHTQEYQFRKWNIFKVIGHNATFYLPFSECYPKAYVPYLPYGSNDFDAVVNANVLGVLALHQASSAKGYRDAVDYLIKKCFRKKYDRAATYYPNRYQFAFALGMAYSNGVSELDTCKAVVRTYLLSRQRKNGSWQSARYINRGDCIQSTAYAINSLMMIDPEPDSEIIYAVQKGMRYLLSKMIQVNGKIYWEGGVMFSGGTVVRTSLFWKSEAYTTALVAHALSLYLNNTEH